MHPDPTPYAHYIDGEDTPSTGQERIEVEYPYTGEVWATVPNGTAEDVDAAVKAAVSAFADWRDTPPSSRRDVLYAIADVIDAHADELAELESRSNGKLINEMGSQMASLGEWYRYYGGLCDTIEGRVIPTENKDNGFLTYTQREPYGVVGIITPWNSPLLLTTFKLAPALAAGNTVVHKPSGLTPVSALRFAELLTDETALPAGAYNVVTGRGDPTGNALTTHPQIAKLAFTGSTETGRHIGHQAAESIVPVTLELGGKSPTIVFPDVALDNAVTGIVKGIFAATGQTCLAGSRVLVQESIFDAVVDRLVRRAESITMGDPMDTETEMGPLVSEEQRETVHGYVEGAREEGATIATGGSQPEDVSGACFFEPTVVIDVDPSMTIVQEEIFGPVAAMLPFSDEAAAIELANQTSYGLAAGIWTTDEKRVRRMVQAIEAGTIWVNEYRVLSYRAPFGGYHESGLGRENGQEALDSYLQTKTVWIDHTGEVTDPFKLG